MMWARRFASSTASAHVVGARALAGSGTAAGGSGGGAASEHLRCLGLGLGAAATVAATGAAAVAAVNVSACEDAEEDDLSFGLLTEEDTKEDIGTPPQFEHWTGAVSGLTNVPTFSGMKTDLTKQITPNFAVVHRMHMGGGPQQGMPDYYQFGAQVFDESLVAIAQIDKSGMVEGQFIVPPGALAKPWQEYGGKLITIFLPDKNDIYWVDFTVNKETFASQLRLASNHQMVPGYMMGLAYTQSITPRFSMGGETTLNINSLQTTSAACAKYNTKDWCATGKFSAAPDRQPGSEATTTEINAQYQRKVVPGRINLGTELSLAMGPGGLHNQVMFGAEFQLKQSKVATSVDGSGKICTTIDSKIDPHMSVTLSAEMAYSAGQPDQATGVPTDAFRCGFGFTMQ